MEQGCAWMEPQINAYVNQSVTLNEDWHVRVVAAPRPQQRAVLAKLVHPSHCACQRPIGPWPLRLPTCRLCSAAFAATRDDEPALRRLPCHWTAACTSRWKACKCISSSSNIIIIIINIIIIIIIIDLLTIMPLFVSYCVRISGPRSPRWKHSPAGCYYMGAVGPAATPRNLTTQAFTWKQAQQAPQAPWVL